MRSARRPRASNIRRVVVPAQWEPGGTVPVLSGPAAAGVAGADAGVRDGTIVVAGKSWGDSPALRRLRSPPPERSPETWQRRLDLDPPVKFLAAQFDLDAPACPRSSRMCRHPIAPRVPARRSPGPRDRGSTGDVRHWARREPPFPERVPPVAAPRPQDRTYFEEKVPVLGRPVVFEDHESRHDGSVRLVYAGGSEIVKIRGLWTFRECSMAKAPKKGTATRRSTSAAIAGRRTSTRSWTRWSADSCSSAPR